MRHFVEGFWLGLGLTLGSLLALGSVVGTVALIVLANIPV